MVKRLISVGGGIASTVLLPLYLFTKFPKDEIELVTCHLPNEDKDVFRLIEVVEKKFSTSVKRIGSNQTPFDIFFKKEFLGNSFIDPCSLHLKRNVMKRYIRETYAPSDIILYVGIGSDETDRTLSIRRNWRELGYQVEFPLMDYNFSKENSMRFCKSFCGFIPRLYLMGFSHNNCSGACVKAGKKEWARLLWFLPEVYEEWMNNENKFRKLYGDYTILRENRNKIRTTLSLQELKERLMPIFKDADNQGTLEGFIKLFKRRDITRYIGEDNDTGCKYCDAMS